MRKKSMNWLKVVQEQQSLMSKETDILYHEALDLLKQLIATPSFSKEEDQTASVLTAFFDQKKIKHSRVGNNVFAVNKHFDDSRPTLLLNSHHDTVIPGSRYTKDPFLPVIEDGKLFGLGS